MLELFKNRPRIIRTAPGERVYAIGDVHGRYDLLKQLLERIIDHWEKSASDFDTVKLIFLGDIIDRGPRSDRVLGLLSNLTRDSEATLLMGNHEDLLLRSMEANAIAQDVWMDNGGLATLKSLGIDPPSREEDCFDFADRLEAGIPAEYVEMLRAAKTHQTSGDYFFVHAGVRPGVSLEKQDERDLFFIRDEFTSADRWHGAVIVHGHTIVTNVEMHWNRIAIDTGAFRSNMLSCICLQDDRHKIITTG